MKTMPASPFRPARGFTFIEVLVAMVFMGILIPVIIQGLSTVHREGIMAERKRTAIQLADAILSETVMTRQINTTSGDFGEDYPGYRWELNDESWPDPMMHLVSVAVYFKVQDSEYQVFMSTLSDNEAVTAAGKTVLGSQPDFILPVTDGSGHPQTNFQEY